MIELPEAVVLARQLKESLSGRTIEGVVAAHSPHKFAWFCGDPSGYPRLLVGRTIDGAQAWGGLVELRLGDTELLFGDGVALRFHPARADAPGRHQLLLELDGGSLVSASVQMYGGLWCFRHGEFDNPYYAVAKAKPSPLSSEFDEEYFAAILASPEVRRLSAKALLATEQRIPGLGNGVLQDILFNAAIHPRRKVEGFASGESRRLFGSLKATLAEMAARGGRDTQVDLHGCPGGYVTRLSRNTAGKPCPSCGTPIEKEAYLGGSVYFCPSCQRRD